MNFVQLNGSKREEKICIFKCLSHYLNRHSQPVRKRTEFCVFAMIRKSWTAMSFQSIQQTFVPETEMKWKRDRLLSAVRKVITICVSLTKSS